ncbi:hypothetical protein [Curtobacterium sp. USHLN213]|uniref:hypothetical protein n=1 Tax=Curtobacterium sp. USHLN213 TaxID=3081255 RepID=UPI003016DDB7
MSILQPIGAFFASMTATDWLSSVAGLGGLVVSLVALHQARQSNLRPNVAFRSQWHEPITYTGPGNEPVDVEDVEVIITNRGAGDAVDVQVTFPLSGQVRSLGTLARDGYGSATFNALDFPGSAPYPFTVTWREYPPANGRIRAKKGVASSSDPTVWRHQ